MTQYLKAEHAVVWISGMYGNEVKDIQILNQNEPPPGADFCDPVGAAYSKWRSETNKQRITQMMELAIELMVEGFDPKYVIQKFCEVYEFRQLGAASTRMSGAITHALVGTSLTFDHESSFDDFLESYKGRSNNEGNRL